MSRSNHQIVTLREHEHEDCSRYSPILERFLHSLPTQVYVLGFHAVRRIRCDLLLFERGLCRRGLLFSALVDCSDCARFLDKGGGYEGF